MICDRHFNDHKLGRSYCQPVSFDRSLGDDIASYVKKHMPIYYNSSDL